MKQLLIILLGLIGVAYGQGYAPTSAKTRFVNGIALGTKLDSYFNAADSNAIYWRADSSLMAKYKGTARALAFDVSGGYIPYSDTTSLLSQVVRTFGTQTIGGNKTFSNDIVIQTITAGRGGGGISANTAFGLNALANNTSGGSNTAIANNTLLGNTTGGNNIAVGANSLVSNQTTSNNLAIGVQALNKLTTGGSTIGIGLNAGMFIADGTTDNTSATNSLFIGNNTRSSASGNSNEIAIGASAIGNGSNTVTIGNSSVTDNYFTGNVRSGGLISTGAISGTSGTYTGLINGSGTVRSTGATSIGLGAGAGAEMRYNSGVGEFFAYDRTALSYMPVKIDGSLVEINSSTLKLTDFGGTIRATGATGGLATGSGVEIRNNSGTGELFTYNRATAAYLPTRVDGSTLALNTLTNGAITLGGAVSGTSLSMSGGGLFNGAVDDGTNKLIVNGGVKGNRYYATGTGFASATSAEIALQNTTATTGRTFVLNSLNSGGFQIFDATASNTTRFLIDSTGAATFSSSVTASSFQVGNGQYYKATRSSGSLVTDMIGIPSGTDNVRILTTGDFNVVNGSLTNLLTISNSGAITASSSVTASSLIKSGGTSSQFLKADGSVDGSTYVNTSSTQSVGGNKTFTSSTVFAGVRFAYSSVSSNYTLTDNDDYVVVTNASTITLPTAVGRAGKRYVLRSTANVGVTSTLATTSSQTVDGAAGPYSFGNGNYNILIVFSDGANWFSEQWITGS